MFVCVCVLKNCKMSPAKLKKETIPIAPNHHTQQGPSKEDP